MSIRPRASWLLVASVVLSTFAAPAAAQDRPLRIAVVDLEVAISQCKRGRALQKMLEEFESKAQAEIDRRQMEIEALQKRLAAGNMKEEIQMQVKTDIADKLGSLENYVQEQQRRVLAKRMEGIQAIELSLPSIFEAVQEEFGLDLILNNTAGVVLMHSERVDITQLILDRLDG